MPIPIANIRKDKTVKMEGATFNIAKATKKNTSTNNHSTVNSVNVSEAELTTNDEANALSGINQNLTNFNDGNLNIAKLTLSLHLKSPLN